MADEPENTPPEMEVEEIDNALRDIFKEFETRLATLEEQFTTQIAAIGERLSIHASEYEHKPARREDNPPGERHWYFRRLGN